MKKLILHIIIFMSLLGIMGFSLPEGQDMGAIIGVVSGLLGALIAFLLLKDKKTRNTASGIFFISFFFAAKLYVLPYYYAETFEYRIKEKYPIFEVINQYYPEQFNKYVNWVKEGYYSGQSVSLADDAHASGQLINYAFIQSIPYASDKSVFNYLLETIQLYKTLYSASPGLILILEFPGREGTLVTYNELASKLSNEELAGIMKVKKEVIESGHKNMNKSIVVNKEIAEADFAEILKMLIQKYEANQLSILLLMYQNLSLIRLSQLK